MNTFVLELLWISEMSLTYRCPSPPSCSEYECNDPYSSPEYCNERFPSPAQDPSCYYSPSPDRIRDELFESLWERLPAEEAERQRLEKELNDEKLEQGRLQLEMLKALLERERLQDVRDNKDHSSRNIGTPAGDVSIETPDVEKNEVTSPAAERLRRGTRRRRVPERFKPWYLLEWVECFV